jgi:hypothetical protein
MAGEPEQWLSCHPVHTPLQISYPVTQAKEVCAGCHDQAYQLLQKHQTKHSALTCAKCHPTRQLLPGLPWKTPQCRDSSEVYKMR